MTSLADGCNPGLSNALPPPSPFKMSELSSRLDGDATCTAKDLLRRLNHNDNSIGNTPTLSLSENTDESMAPRPLFPHRLPTVSHPAESSGRIFTCKHLADDQPTPPHFVASRNITEPNSPLPYHGQTVTTASAAGGGVSDSSVVPPVPPHLSLRTSSKQPKVNRLRNYDDFPSLLENHTSSSRRGRSGVQMPQLPSTTAIGGGGLIMKRYPALVAVPAASRLDAGKSTLVPSYNSASALSQPKRPPQSVSASSAGYFQQPRYQQQPNSSVASSANMITSEEAPDGTFEISV